MLKLIIVTSLIIFSFQKSDVYFSKVISSDRIVEMFKMLKFELKGKVGLKVHSGEKDGIYYLRPDFLQKMYDLHSNSSFIECNTAYENWRHNTSIHKRLAEEHGWYEKNRSFIIMDEDPTKDWNISIPYGKMIKTNIVGEHLKEIDSCVVLAHFKGHSWGGYGGALKQLSIGFSSQAGKTLIHTAGNTSDWHLMRERRANQPNFTAAMGDAASSIVKYFKEQKKGIAFINVIVNVSKICDCGGGPIVPPPKIHNIGILASMDPVAIDAAALDLIKKTTDPGTDEWLSQLYDRKGENTLYVAEEHGIGTREYNLIYVDGENPFPWKTLILGIVCFLMVVILGIVLFCYCKLNKQISLKEHGLPLANTSETS